MSLSHLLMPWRQQGKPALLLAYIGTFSLFLLVLAACGASSSPAYTYTPTPNTTHAYLYSQLNYPLQVPVNNGDTVQLTLSLDDNILRATPGTGRGTGTVGQAIVLPTDLQNYRDIGTSADILDDTGPVVWQLTSAQRQSLLTGPPSASARHYLDSVTYTWNIKAVASGENTAKISLGIYYIYRDGSEHDGSVEVTQSPIPIVSIAVEQNPFLAFLAGIKFPLASVTGLAGFAGVLAFLWNLYQTASNVSDAVKGGAKAARVVRQRFTGASQLSDAVPDTKKRKR